MWYIISFMEEIPTGTDVERERRKAILLGLNRRIFGDSEPTDAELERQVDLLDAIGEESEQENPGQ